MEYNTLHILMNWLALTLKKCLWYRVTFPTYQLQEKAYKEPVDMNFVNYSSMQIACCFQTLSIPKAWVSTDHLCHVW